MSNTFGQTAQLNIANDIAIKSDELTIDFEVKFDDDVNPNESTIEIYNLSASTISKITRNDKVTLSAGYKSDGSGVILDSRVSSVRTRREGVDKVTLITAIDGPNLDGIRLPEQAETTGKGKKKKVKFTRKKTYGKNVRASHIIRDLASLLSVAIGKIKLVKDVIYAKGYTVNGKVVEELDKLARACGVSFFINKQRLYICSLAEASSSTTFELSSDTGMIGSPEPYENDKEKGYKVKMLLQHRITTAALITIKSRTANGKFRVRRGKHSRKGSDHVTEIEVVRA